MRNPRMSNTYILNILNDSRWVDKNLNISLLGIPLRSKAGQRRVMESTGKNTHVSQMKYGSGPVWKKKKVFQRFTLLPIWEEIFPNRKRLWVSQGRVWHAARSNSLSNEISWKVSFIFCLTVAYKSLRAQLKYFCYQSLCFCLQTP